MSAKICNCDAPKAFKGHVVGALVKTATDHIILATYTGWINLTFPSQTYEKNAYASFDHLPKGTCVQYTQEVD